jgi:hypothetical protein
MWCRYICILIIESSTVIIGLPGFGCDAIRAMVQNIKQIGAFQFF